MAKKPRNRAAQDANLINLRALKKRVMNLEAAAWLAPELERRLIQLDRRVAKLEGRGKA